VNEQTLNIKAKNLKDLGANLDKLYNIKYQIYIHLADKKYQFYVILKDVRGNVDCKLSSISANMWTRTKAGIEYKKYSRLQDLQTALKKEVHAKIETSGEITFSLCSGISYM
jgi:hypothetical protein